MIGNILTNTPLSAYQPSKEVADLTSHIKDEFTEGHDILHRSWEEMNDYSIIERMNRDQRTLNSFVDEDFEDPNEAWKWRGTRSTARNQAMAMHAHLTFNYIVPGVFAQNDNQEVDQNMGRVMGIILEWMTYNSNYRPTFLLATLGMLANPVTFVTADYKEVFQKVRDILDDGSVNVRQKLDEVFSGFQTDVRSADQVLITNVYEQNLQKQRSILPRRYIDFSEAKQVYGEHPNFVFVQPGIKSIISEDDGLFYDVRDDDNHQHEVEEVRYLNRSEDMEIILLNGIYMGHENVEANPIKHRDNRDAPKYNVVQFGYERINEHFFYYKSLMNRVGWDDQLIDAMYEMTMNRQFLDLAPPVAITGVDDLDTEIAAPSTVVAIANKDAEVKEIFPRAGNAGFAGLDTVEKSINEAGLSGVQLGTLPDASQKAFTVARAERNAQVLLSGVSKNLGQSVAQLGQLMVDIALQHITAPEVDELTGAMTYRPFVLADQMVEGKKVSKKVLFDESLMGSSMSEKQKEERSVKLAMKAGFPDMKEQLWEANPHLFSKMKYMVRVEPDAMRVKNDATLQALMTRMYSLTRNDPLIDSEALVRKLMSAFFKGEGEELIAKKRTQEILGQPVETPKVAPTTLEKTATGAAAMGELPG